MFPPNKVVPRRWSLDLMFARQLATSPRSSRRGDLAEFACTQRLVHVIVLPRMAAMVRRSACREIEILRPRTISSPTFPFGLRSAPRSEIAPALAVWASCPVLVDTVKVRVPPETQDAAIPHASHHIFTLHVVR